MEFVAILRVLWHRRVLVGAGALVAIALAIFAAAGEGSHGTASTRLVFDTPRSQLVHPAPSGSESLAWRAAFVSDLMASRPVSRRIAREAGIPANQLAVVDPPLVTPTVLASLPRRASQAAATVPEPYVITVRFGLDVPIVSVEAVAPDRAGATRLAGAGAAALMASASRRDTADLQGFVVESISPIRSAEIAGRSGLVKGLAIFVFLFVLWCAGVVIVPSLLRAWRAMGRIQAA